MRMQSSELNSQLLCIAYPHVSSSALLNALIHPKISRVSISVHLSYQISLQYDLKTERSNYINRKRFMDQ